MRFIYSTEINSNMLNYSILDERRQWWNMLSGRLDQCEVPMRTE